MSVYHRFGYRRRLLVKGRHRLRCKFFCDFDSSRSMRAPMRFFLGITQRGGMRVMIEKEISPLTGFELAGLPDPESCAAQQYH